MIIVTFRTPEGEYDTYMYNDADELRLALEDVHSMDVVTGVWEVNG